MENRNGLVVAAKATLAIGTAEREAAREMVAGLARGARATLGADKNYDTRDCVVELRDLGVTPHVAQHINGRRSAIDGRTTRHPGYAVSQRIRKRIEEVLGCARQTFVELLPTEVARRSGQHTSRLEEPWEARCRNSAGLWGHLRAEGLGGYSRVVTEWVRRPRRSERPGGGATGRVPPARTIARVMLAGRDRLARAEAVRVTTVEATVPALATARDLVGRYHRVLHSRTPDALATWINDVSASMLAALGRGTALDQAA